MGLNEKLEPLIPAGKIASFATGEMVGLVARDVPDDNRFTGEYTTSAIHCRINLDLDAIRREETSYPPMPVYYDFQGKREEMLFANFNKINGQVLQMVEKIMSG